MGGQEGGCRCSSKKWSFFVLLFCSVAFIIFIVITPCAPLRSASIFRPSAHAAQEAFAWAPGWRRLQVPLAPPLRRCRHHRQQSFFLVVCLANAPVGQRRLRVG